MTHFDVTLCKTISITVPVDAENELCARSIALDANARGEYSERWEEADVSDDIDAMVTGVES